jgi:hypothetical protein
MERDVATIIAISIVASVVGNLLHEGVGDGGACLLTGAHAKVLSTVHFECSLDNRFISPGGTLVNCIAGFVCWLALRLTKQAHARLRDFLWLLMIGNLLSGGGYFMFSGIGNFGDWADGLTLLGVVSYLLVVWLALQELRPFLSERDWRRGGAKDLTIIPYITGGGLSTAAGILNPVSWILVPLSAVAASFGGTSGMAWMTQCLGTRFAPRIPTQPFTLQRSRAWIVAALIVAALFIGVLGPGVRFL